MNISEIIDHAEKQAAANLEMTVEKLFGRVKKQERHKAVLKARKSIKRSYGITLVHNMPSTPSESSEKRIHE